MMRRALLPVVSLAVCLSLGAGCRSKKQVRARARNKTLVTSVDLIDPEQRKRLLRGVYEPAGGWAWTSRVFAVSLDLPEHTRPLFVALDCTLPVELMGLYPSVTLMARVNGIEAGRGTYTRDGRYEFTARVPESARRRSPAEVEFELDSAARDPVSGREQGLIAVRVSFFEYEETAQFREEQMRLAREGLRKVMEAKRQQLPRESELQMLKLFHSLPIWENMWYHNTRIIKNPLDLWMAQQIIYEVQPSFVVETGTWYGGSALYWAGVLNNCGLKRSHVFTVDLQDLTKAVSANPLWKDYVTFFHGSSTDTEIVNKIASQVRGLKTIVMLDSSHAMRHVLQELRMYAPMVSPGSYLIVEDTHLDGIPTHPEQGAGPMAAVEKVLASGEGQDFERDLTREALIMTFNPGGWLRKKAPAQGAAK